MSNPIEHVRVDLDNVTIAEADVRAFDEEMFPEDCFVFDLKYANGLAHVENLTWCGIASERTYPYFVDHVLPKLRGRGSLTVEWEDGSQERLSFSTGNTTRGSRR